MKRTLSLLISVLFLVFFHVSFCWAYDFGDMTNQQLYDFRPSLQYATEDETKAYWNEWDKRIKMMTVQEKEKYNTEPTQDNQIKFLYSPGMGYEGPISKEKGIYGSATRPVYKPIEEQNIYGIEKDDTEKEQVENKPVEESPEKK